MESTTDILKELKIRDVELYWGFQNQPISASYHVSHEKFVKDNWDEIKTITIDQWQA